MIFKRTIIDSDIFLKLDDDFNVFTSELTETDYASYYIYTLGSDDEQFR